MNDEQIERVAEAIWRAGIDYCMGPDDALEGSWDELREPHKGAALFEARAAITAMDGQTATPSEAAKVLLGDDITLSHMSKAMHDGPLMADEYEFRADTEAGSWCLDCVRSALRAIAQEGE